MNTEHKYKAWIKKEQKMYTVTAIDFKLAFIAVKESLNQFPFADIELLEFTTKIDKNGKDIYQSDWIQFEAFDQFGEEYIAIKLVESEQFDGWYPLNRHDEYNHFSPFRTCTITSENIAQCEIIGNKYENPELEEK